MRKFLGSFLRTPQAIKQHKLCTVHTPQNSSTPHAVPYTKDFCNTCNAYQCHVCSEKHISLQCDVSLSINKELGMGVERDFNLGRLVKVDLRDLKCICGKPLGRNAAICAACGLASCSEACHKKWEQEGMCKFRQNFYSIPDNFNMRSITISNIDHVQNSDLSEWIIANKSSSSMINCYASNQQKYVYLQRGFRNYGRPNDQLINRMEVMPDGIDFYSHYHRRCSCDCQKCKNKNKIVQVHPVLNCTKICNKIDYEYLERVGTKAEFQKQCKCDCEFCRSGIVVSTHRKLDCAMYCSKSEYNRNSGDFMHIP